MKTTSCCHWKIFATLMLMAVAARSFGAGTLSTNADLQIGKTASTNLATVGQQFTFTLSFTNAGPATVTNTVTVNDSLPAGFQYLSDNGQGLSNNGTYSAGVGQWKLVPGAVGVSQRLTITVQAVSPGTYTNIASINVPAGITDTNLNNNTSSVPVTVMASNTPIILNCSSNITVAATGSNGATVFYSVSASGGCNPPPFVNATPPSGSIFPIGTTMVNVTASDSCSHTTNCSFTVTVTNTPIVLNCSSNITVTATSSNGATVFFSVSATGGCNPPPFVNATPPSGSTFPVGTTMVSATASDSCGQSTNCNFTVTVTSQPSQTADLQITKTAGTNSVKVGQQVVFNLVLRNLGPGNVSTNIVVTDCLPSGFMYVTDSTVGNSSNGTYSPGTCWWTLTSGLGSNSIASLQITAQATTIGAYTNTATVAVPSGVMDPNLNNNTSSVPVTVTSASTQADLKITKTASTNSVAIGQNVIFTLALQNLGPSTVTNDIVVTDCLPSGYVYVTDSTVGNSTNGTYSPGTCWWTFTGGLGTNVTANLQITAQATNTGTFTNTASVAVPTGVTDTNLTNNTSSVVVTNRLPKADLQITKSASGTNAQVGQQVSFTLALQNLGPDYVSNDIVVSDCLPAGLTYVSDNTGSGFNGSYSPGTCLWTLSGGLGTNVTVFLIITTQATTNICVTNTAQLQVPAGITDPNTNNNTSSAQVCINPLYRLSGTIRNCSSNGTPLPLVTVTLSGPTNATTVTDTNGNYSFSNLLTGNYTVTPTQTGNTFAPGNAAVTVNGNTTAPTFAGSTPLIQGTVTYGTNASPIGGVPIKLTGPVTTTVLTGTNGHYIFTNTPPGNYTVTPVPTNGYTFTPTNKAIVLSGTNCSGLANFASSNRTVKLVALEVTQVIQDWSNSVPLIQAKKTYVRAHLQLPTNTVPPVLVQGARLFGTGPGGPLPGSPLSAINTNGGVIRVTTTNAAALRGTWTNSLNFQLPASWTTVGAVTLQFVWSNNVTLVYSAPPPAGGTNGTAAVNFTPSTVLPLKFYAFNWTNAGTLLTMNAAAYADLPGRLVSLYPVPDATKPMAIMTPPAMLSVPPTIPAPLVARGEKLADWAILLANTKLQTQRFFDQIGGLFSGTGSNYVYYGAIAGPSPGTLGWANAFVSSSNTVANRLIYISSGFVVSNFYTTDRHTHAHEIGHTLGRPHDVFATGSGACSEGGPINTAYPLFQTVAGVYTNKPAIGPMTNGVNAMIYGLDTLTLTTTNLNPVVDPNIYFDVMSYCDVLPLDVWISPFTYAAMRTNITNNFNVPVPPAAGPARKYLVVRGYLDNATDYVELMPVLTITTTNVPPTPPAGNYYVQYYDANTNLLGQVSFTPDEFDVEEGDDGKQTEGMFLIPVPDDNNNIRQITVWDGPTLLATETGSPNTPVVSGVNLTTTGGVSFSGTGPLTVNWSGSDADPGSQLSYLIQYSTDGGASWDMLDADWTGQSYTIDSQFLRATTQGLVRIIANDGFNNSAPAVSASFTVPNHAPKVSLTQPMGGMLFVGDQQVFLEASVMDPLDGLLDNGSVLWSSSRDGYLGSGDSVNFESDILSEGAHVITVTATDSLGLTNSASVQIFVLRDSPPQLAIQYLGSPTNQALLSWPSASTNFVLESATSLTPANWTPVTAASVVDGDTQTVTVNVSGTARFFRLRMP